MKKNEKNILSQEAAGKIVGVKRQTICKIKKEGRYNFFVGTRVDINHPDWKSYVHERGVKGARKIIAGVTKTKTGKNKLHNKFAGKNKIENGSVDIQSHPFTGGVNPDNFIPQNTADMKRLAEIVKLKVEIEKMYGLLIDREMIQPVMETIGRTIEAYFVSISNKVSKPICRKLDRSGMEKEVIKIISPVVAKGIQQMKTEVEKVLKIKK